MSANDRAVPSPEADTDPTRWLRLWAMMNKPQYRLKEYAASVLLLPQWNAARVYDGKLYLFLPGIVLIYDYNYLLAFARLCSEANQENPNK